MASDNSMNRRAANGRKSLSIPPSNPTLRDRSKKRAHSMAPGPSKTEEDLTPRRRQRRSLVPSRGILKQSTSYNGRTLELNLGDITAANATTLSVTSISDGQQSMDTTSIINFDGNSRKSLGGDRRVSFAAHAHVRLFDKDNENTNGSSTPSSSPAGPSPISGEQAEPASVPTPADAASPSVNRRRSSGMSTRRRSSLGVGIADDGEGEESMVLDSEDGSVDLHQDQVDYSSAGEEDISADMDITEEVPTNIRRRSSIRRRESTMSEPMEFTVAVEHGIRGPEEPSETFLQLQALANGSTEERSPEPDVPVDMDLDQALERMRRASGGIPVHDPLNSSFNSSSDGSFDLDNQTLNITAMSGKFLSDMDETVDLSAAIKTGPSLLDSPIAPPRMDSSPPPTPSLPPQETQAAALPKTTAFSARPPQATRKSLTSTPKAATPGTPGTGSTPRRAAPTFTAAFAPSVKSPRKRLHDEPSASPAKRLAVGEGAQDKRAIPAPVRTPVRGSFTPKPRLRAPVPTAKPQQSTSSKLPLAMSRARRSSVAYPQLQDENNVRDENSLTPQPRTPLADVTPILPPPSRGQSDVPSPTPSVNAPIPSSPALSMEMDDDTEELPQATQQPEARAPSPLSEESDDEDDQRIPPMEGVAMSLNRFLETTGITFMDGITHTRRSTFNGVRREEHSKEPTLADYAIAMAVEYGQYEYWIWASTEMERFMQEGNTRMKELASSIDENPPMLFVEYLEADEEGRAEIESYLAMLKTHSRQEGKAKWYQFRMSGVSELQGPADQHKELLMNDHKAVREAEARVDEILPELEEQLRLLDLELEAERSAVAEIETCDQQELRDLRTTIEEQEIQLDLQRKDLAEAEEKRQRLEDRLNEVNQEIKEVRDEIEGDKVRLQLLTGSTSKEMLRQKDRLHVLQNLILWRATKVSPELMQFVYSDQLQASIVCSDYVPCLSSFRIQALPRTSKDPLPEFTKWTIDTAKQRVRNLHTASVKSIVKQLYCYFGSCELLRAELMLMRIRHPLRLATFEDDTCPGLQGLDVTAIILFEDSPAKAHVTFRIRNHVLNTWPQRIQEVECGVRVVYGKIDGDGIMKAVQGQLADATEDKSYAILVDACAEAASCCV